MNYLGKFAKKIIVVGIYLFALSHPFAQPSFMEESINSKYSVFLILQTELGRYEIANQKPWILLELNTYHLGKRYPNLIKLRDRLEITGDLDPNQTIDPLLYDVPLISAIKNFQARHGLASDGVIGKATLSALNIKPAERIKAIQINIQRWVELSKKLGSRYILVNIPDYQLYLVDKNQQALTMKTVVGKPTLQTPELVSKITRIVFNPYWNVPDKIAANDLAPKVKEDPYYLDDMHIKVFVRNEDEQIDHQEIDWERVEEKNSPYLFRQEPGDDNALGLVKFEFPNNYDIYLHDTPLKNVFHETNRDLSHGCIRLEKPFDLVNYLLQNNPNWDEEKIQDILASHKPTYVSLSQSIPLIITYLTVWVDPNGVVNYRRDIYNRDTPIGQ